MKRITLMGVILISIFLTSYPSIHAQKWIESLSPEKRNNFYELRNSFQEYYKDKDYETGSMWKQFKRWEYFWERRIKENGEFSTADEIKIELNNFLSKQSKHLSPLALSSDWKELGPVDVPINKLNYKSEGIGRINVVRFHPNNPSEIWVGTAGGGAWKSTNSGGSWKIVPTTDFLSMGVSDIAISKSNPNIIYLLTGDVDGYFSTHSTYSVGVLRSDDGGETWRSVTENYELKDRELFSRIIVDSDDPDKVVVGSKTGILKTTNGGESWTLSLSGNFIRDIEPCVVNDRILFAAEGSINGNSAIFKSNDFGDSWVQVLNVPGGNRIELATTTLDYNYLYAVVSNSGTNAFHSFWQSKDLGETWVERKNTNPNLLGWNVNGNDMGKGQGRYDLAICVSPYDKKTVFVGGVNLWKTTNEGSSWTCIAHWMGSAKLPFVHADIHDIKQNPHNKHLYCTNDGGIYLSTDNGSSWIDRSDDIGVQQLYKIAVAQTKNGVYLGGSQDNGTQLKVGNKWYHVNGGDGMDCAIDPNNDKIMYSSLYYGDFKKSTDGGMRFSRMLNSGQTGEYGAWVTPFTIYHKDSDYLYAGYSNVFMSSNQGLSWAKISNWGSSAYKISAIAVSPTNNNYIYAARRGAVYMTSNGGNSWDLIYSKSSSIPTSIAVSWEDPQKIWVTYAGYESNTKLMQYDGDEWENLSSGLPNVPVNSVVVQKNTGNRLFIGTDIGVFIKEDENSNWRYFSNNLPTTIITDLEIQYSSGKLVAGTYGRGMFETKIFDCEIDIPEIITHGSTKLCFGEKLDMEVKQNYDSYKWSNGETARSITVEKPGVYHVRVENQDGCIAYSDNLEVEVLALPELAISITGNNPLCLGDSLKLRASLGFDEYSWSTGEEGKVIYVKEAGIYELYAITENGCKDTVEIEVTTVNAADKPEVLRNGDVLSSSLEAKKYQWYHEDKKIYSATEKSYTATEIGNYRVEIFNDNNCSNISEPYNLLEIGIKMSLNRETQISPNPSNGIFNIDIPSKAGEKIKFRVYGIDGKNIFEKEFIAESDYLQTSINLGKEAKSVYYLEITIDGKSRIEKLILK